MLKATALFLLLSLGSANAGVLTVASYPARHPKKTAAKVSYPVRHPVKTAKYLLPPFVF